MRNRALLVATAQVALVAIAAPAAAFHDDDRCPNYTVTVSLTPSGDAVRTDVWEDAGCDGRYLAVLGPDGSYLFTSAPPAASRAAGTPESSPPRQRPERRGRPARCRRARRAHESNRTHVKAGHRCRGKRPARRG